MSDKLYVINGVSHTADEWEDIYNLKWSTIRYNLKHNRELRKKERIRLIMRT